MKTIRARLPDSLHAKLKRVAKARKQSQAQLVREVLDWWLDGKPSPKPVTVLERAGDLLGCVKGTGDLSTNPKYMEGFGES